MSASTGSGAGDDRRREATFTWVSTGRRIAAARVGRRWADVRGSLLAAATLALLQAALVYVALRAVQETRPVAVPAGADRRRHDARRWSPGSASSGTRSAPSCRSARRPPRRSSRSSRLRGRRCATGSPRRRARSWRPRSRSRASATARSPSPTARAVLAHAGLASDHHGAGTGAPPGAVAAMAARRVARLPVGWGHGCDGRDCPLRVGGRGAARHARRASIGSLILFSEGALNVSDRDRAIAQSLSATCSRPSSRSASSTCTRSAAASAELAALQAQIEPHFLFNALNTIAAFCRTRPDEARRLVLAFADYCRSSLRRPARVRRLRRRARPRRRVPRARGGALRRLARDRAARRAGRADRRRCRRSSCSRWSRTRSSTARPTGRCGSPSAPSSGSAGCACRCATTGAASRRRSPSACSRPASARGAAGLGLASVDQRLTALYGEEGRLRIVSSPLFGTRGLGADPGRSPPETVTSLLALIVDDEAPARAELRFLLEGIGGVEVVGEAASVREALALASRVDYDVVFLDITHARPDRHGRRARAVVVAAQPRRRVRDGARRPRHPGVHGRRHRLPAEAGLGGAPRALAAARAGAARRRRSAAHGRPGAAEGAGHAQGRDAAARRRRGAATRRPTATTAGSTPTASGCCRASRCASSRTPCRRRSSSASTARISSTCGASWRWRRSAPGRSGVRLADGTVLEVARRQTRALKQHLGLR